MTFTFPPALNYSFPISCARETKETSTFPRFISFRFSIFLRTFLSPLKFHQKLFLSSLYVEKSVGVVCFDVITTRSNEIFRLQLYSTFKLSLQSFIELLLCFSLYLIRKTPRNSEKNVHFPIFFCE